MSKSETVTELRYPVVKGFTNVERVHAVLSEPKRYKEGCPKHQNILSLIVRWKDGEVEEIHRFEIEYIDKIDLYNWGIDKQGKVYNPGSISTTPIEPKRIDGWSGGCFHIKDLETPFIDAKQYAQIREMFPFSNFARADIVRVQLCGKRKQNRDSLMVIENIYEPNTGRLMDFAF